MPLVLAVRADGAIPDRTSAGTFLSSRHDAILGLMSETQEIRAWAKANGWDVPDKGRLPKAVRDAYHRTGPVSLPGPDDPDDSDEVLDLDDQDWGNDWPEDGLPPMQDGPPARANTGARGRREASQSDPGPVDGQPDEDSLPDDPPPAKLTSIPGGKGKRGRRPTAGVKTEINAKVGLMLEIPGRVWEARDPLCGGTFVQQRPAISSALTELILQSPDLVEWFMGAGAG